MRTLVVLPTYEEGDNITTVLARVRQALPDGWVLVVDDSSPDGTADLAEKAAAELGNIDVMRRPAKSGLGSAYRDGFRWGLDRGYEVLIEMDSDLSHDPAVLPELVAAVEAGADVAIGSRYVSGGAIPDWSRHRRLLSEWGNRYAAFMLRIPVRDSTAGFRAYRGDLLQRLGMDNIRADGYGFQIEMTYRSHHLGANFVELPITFRERGVGSSKMSSRIVVEALALVTVWGLRDRVRRLRRR